MAIPFARSMRSLRADSFRFSGGLLVVALLLLAAWAGWFFFAELSLYEVSQEARVEVTDASHPVAAPVSGRIVATHVALGREVRAGDPLIELEARSEALQLAEERSAREGTQSQLAKLGDEIASEEAALERFLEAARLELEEQQATLRGAQAEARYAEREHASIAQLAEQGLKSQLELDKAVSDVEKTTAIVERQRVAVSRRKQELAVEERDRRTRLERLRGQASQLEGSITTSERTEERLGVELEERIVRAPISGTIGEVAESLRAGSFVAAGQALCAIVPRGDSHIVVAEFEPGEALGRIRPGQEARLRLDGYPWAQYGLVRARVASVGSEVRDGRVRVELGIEPDVPPGIILEHGLPGELEVEVEKASPAIVVLRSVGKLVEGA